MSERMRVAAIQTIAGGDVAENLAQAELLVRAAAAEGAQLIVLPEYFGILGAHATDKLAAKERDGAGPQQDFLARMARESARHRRGRQRADRQRRSCPGAQRVPGLRSRWRARCTLRQDPPVPLHERRRGLRRNAHDPAGRCGHGVRRTVRPGWLVHLLRRAVSRAVSRARRLCVDSCVRRHSPRRRAQRTGSCCCAPARWKTSAMCLPPRRVACTRTAGGRGDIRCWSIPGAQSSRRRMRDRGSSWATSIRRESRKARSKLPALTHRVM